MNSGIYSIICKIDKKLYVGSTKDFKVRKSVHFATLKSNTHTNRYFQRAFNKYGIENFEFKVIEEVVSIKEKLIEREQYWMDKFESYNPEKGYNLRPKANSNLGFKQTETAKRAIGLGSLGRKVSKETRQKISEGRKGKKFTILHRRNLSQAKIGKLSPFRGRQLVLREIRVCVCGCKKEFLVLVTSKKRYVKGHYWQNREKPLEMCLKIQRTLTGRKHGTYKKKTVGIQL